MARPPHIAIEMKHGRYVKCVRTCIKICYSYLLSLSLSLSLSIYIYYSVYIYIFVYRRTTTLGALGQCRHFWQAVQHCRRTYQWQSTTLTRPALLAGCAALLQDVLAGCAARVTEVSWVQAPSRMNSFFGQLPRNDASCQAIGLSVRDFGRIRPLIR